MYNSRMNKIQAPTLPQTILHRSSLIDTLHTAISSDTSTCKLFLVCAPGGYGKTTLLVDFAHHTSIPCCWYFLDNTDNDICSFIQTLLASIRRHFSQFGKDLDTRFQPLSTLTHKNANSPILHTFIDHFLLSLEMDISTRFAILLCNYHEVNENPVIQAFLDRLARYLPSHCVLVIESRVVPTLKLAPLMAQEHLMGIGSGQLRFNTEEIQALSGLQKMVPISKEDAAYLATTFEGWIVGILLSTRLGNGYLLSSMYAKESMSDVPILHTDRNALFSYMVDEIFKDELETYTFLKEISLLQNTTPEICNQLLGITDGESRLADIERRGFFISHSGDGPQFLYTCHPVLRELLYNEACRENPQRMTALHRRAGDIFFQLGDYDQAIIHTMAIHDDERAVAIIQAISTRVLRQSYVETLINWIDILRPDILDRSPQILLLRANIHIRRGEYIQARTLLEKADKALELSHEQLLPVDGDLTPTILAEILVVKSAILFRTGHYTSVQQLCQQALTLLSVDEKQLCALAYCRLGISTCLLGDLQMGIAHLHRALQFLGHYTADDLVADIHSSLANAYSWQGNIALAEHHRSRAFAICKQTGNVRSHINNMIWKAILQRNRGLFSDAESLFLEIITMAQNEQFSSGHAYALFNLGEVYIDQGRFQDALMITGDALALARKLEDNYLINQALCSLSLEYLFLNDISTALQFLDQVTAKTTTTASYEIALREQVRGTILLQQKCYLEAYTCLKAVEQSLKQEIYTRLSIQTTIRLAACQNMLGYASEAELMMERAAMFAQRCNCEELALIELRRFPALWKAVQVMPDQACLPEWRTTPHPTSLEKQAQEAIETETQIHKAISKLVVLPEMPPVLEIHSFGEPTISLHGTPITRWRMARSIELCFFLIDYNRPIRQEQILTALWEEVDENTSQTLRSAIHHLRKTIGASCIVYDAKMYSLNLEALYGKSVWYDVTLFRQNYEKGQKALKEEDIPLAKSHFEKTVDLYRGDYVQSFYSNWCVVRRDELRQLYFEARQALALIAWEDEQFEECATHCQYVLAVDNYLEEAHYRLMRCYLRMGKRGLALRQYQRYSEILQEELSISPGPPIQRLYQKLVAGSL